MIWNWYDVHSKGTCRACVTVTVRARVRVRARTVMARVHQGANNCKDKGMNNHNCKGT